MSQHEGVSCDSCTKGNFRGKRYKCLVCFDYDLCEACYENGTRSSRHTLDHPMQCILTRSDFELFYAGEPVQFDQPQSFTCPYCGRIGMTEAQLHEHVTGEHLSANTEVICPVCASLPGGDPNRVTDDLGGHLNMEHRNTRDNEEPLSRNIRRIFHPVRGGGPPRIRRGNPFSSAASSNSTTASATFSSARDSIDPIAELLSQLSGVRRAAQQQSAAVTASQLQLLQQQLQFERQQVQQARDRLERLPARKQAVASNNTTPKDANTGAAKEQFLLPRYCEEAMTKMESDKEKNERLSREQFCQELFFSFISPKPDGSTQSREQEQPGSMQSGDSASLDSVGRNLEKIYLDDMQSAPKEVSHGQDASHTASGSSKSKVGTKMCNDCETDYVYNSDSDRNSSVP